jgi:hypothetical protein
MPSVTWFSFPQDKPPAKERLLLVFDAAGEPPDAGLMGTSEVAVGYWTGDGFRLLEDRGTSLRVMFWARLQPCLPEGIRLQPQPDSAQTFASDSALYSEPTIDDFLDNIRWHLAEAIKRAQASIGRIKSDHAARGILRSGMTYRQIFGVVTDEFEAGTRAVLGELRRAVRITTLDRQALREVTVQELQDFAIQAKALIEIPTPEMGGNILQIAGRSPHLSHSPV